MQKYRVAEPLNSRKCYGFEQSDPPDYFHQILGYIAGNSFQFNNKNDKLIDISLYVYRRANLLLLYYLKYYKNIENDD